MRNSVVPHHTFAKNVKRLFGLLQESVNLPPR